MISNPLHFSWIWTLVVICQNPIGIIRCQILSGGGGRASSTIPGIVPVQTSTSMTSTDNGIGQPDCTRKSLKNSRLPHLSYNTELVLILLFRKLSGVKVERKVSYNTPAKFPSQLLAQWERRLFCWSNKNPLLCWNPRRVRLRLLSSGHLQFRHFQKHFLSTGKLWSLQLS